jgi:hypothetical protein
MDFDGVVTDIELSRDLAITQPLGDEEQNLQFTLAEFAVHRGTAKIVTSPTRYSSTNSGLSRNVSLLAAVPRLVA